MYCCNHSGAYPRPHSHKLSVPEMVQELYAKINECVDAVNKCIEMVDTSNNIVENWNDVKAQMDLTMTQYATVMGEYARIMNGYEQELGSLEERVNNVNIDVETFESLITGLRNEANSIVEDMRDDISAMADCIVEVGTTDGWEYARYKSGKIVASAILTFSECDVIQSNGTYRCSLTVASPFGLTYNPDTRVFLSTNHSECYVSYGTAYPASNISVSLTSNKSIANYAAKVMCRVEGVLSE